MTDKDVEQKRDEALRRMLNTPPKPHPKPKKAAKPKKAKKA